MTSLLWLLAFACLASVGYCGNERPYTGDALFAVAMRTQEDLDRMRMWQLHGLAGHWWNQLDFWKLPARVGQEAHVRVPRQLLSMATSELQRAGMRWRILQENIADIIVEEMQLNSRASGDHQKFLPINEIDAFVDNLVAKCSTCSVESIGNSYEGRQIRVVRVGNSAEKPTILLEGGVHAREWISPAALLYILDKLITDSSYADIFNSWNVAMIVVLNPDGYEYTHTNSRLWRKNRSREGMCFGVDLNRNFGHEWGGAGTSSWPCSDLYRGKSAFSEPESDSLRKFLLNNLASIRAYWAVHSYGQLWLHPWGYARGVNPSNVAELKSAALAGEAALRAVNGRSYTVGHSADVLYPAAGGSDDFALSQGVQFAYTLELPDTGRYGFVLPPSFIVPVGEETLAALAAFLRGN